MGPDVNAIANTTVSLYRGEETDEYADVVDTDVAPYKTEEPASIIEIPQPNVQSTTTPTPRVIRRARMRIKSSIDIRKGDRVKDERSGQFYAIDAVTPPLGNPAMDNDKRVDLRWQ